MSRWTHALCDPCWQRRNPGKEPARVREPDEEKCCACEMPTRSGIYVREHPSAMACGGAHAEEGA